MSGIRDTGAEKLIRYRKDPLYFVVNEFGAQPDIWQVEGLNAAGGADYNPRRRIGMKACTGPGKSTLLAWLGWHRLACFGSKGEHPKGAAISGEGRDNLRDNLWAELSKWQKRSEFLMRSFTQNQSQIYENKNPETWFLSARSYPKDANAEAIGRSLAGLHSPFPFTLLDETGMMPPTVGQKASQIFTGGVVDGLIAAAGNPTSTSGLLYDIFNNQKHLWDLITITADPDDPRRTPRVDIDHARQQIELYGRDNSWVMATILGLFPPTTLNALLSMDDVEKATSRNYSREAYMDAQKRIGVDVARFGDDSTILFPRQGLRAFEAVEMRNQRSTTIADRVIYSKNKWGSELEFVDGTGGYGAGVIDSMVQRGYNPIEVQFAGKANDPRFANKRMEIWWNMAEHVKRGLWLPRDAQLAKELVAPTYSFNSAGKMILEPKEFIKSRLGFSPDRADGLALTYAQPDIAGRKTLLGQYLEQKQNKVDHEYDPYSDERMNS